MDQGVLTVSQLTAKIKNLLEGSFEDVWVTGEIGGYKAHTSGHLYFTLKDEYARLGAVVFRGFVRYLEIDVTELKDGMQVVCHGRLNVYEPRGEYKLIVDRMRPAGLGKLLQQIEELKRRLATEGLFDASRKRPIPVLPRVIGIVTSPTSAAIQDMLRIIEERFPSSIKLYPAATQGDEAPADLVKGLQVLDLDPDVDVIIIGRGGGSPEDLAPFSDERVVRAVAACTKPVISAVGHEIDFPLCDLAADARAATPTAAAQLVVPDRAELLKRLADLARRLEADMERYVTNAQFALADKETRLIELAERFLLSFESRLSSLEARLMSQHPAVRLERVAERLSWLNSALQEAIDRYIHNTQNQLDRAAALLDQLGPTNQLKRGYSVVRFADGKVVTSAAQTPVGTQLEIVLHEGRLDSRVTGRHFQKPTSGKSGFSNAVSDQTILRSE